MIETITVIYTIGFVIGLFAGGFFACDKLDDGVYIAQNSLSTATLWPLWTTRFIWRGIKRQWND